MKRKSMRFSALLLALIMTAELLPLTVWGAGADTEQRHSWTNFIDTEETEEGAPEASEEDGPQSEPENPQEVPEEADPSGEEELSPAEDTAEQPGENPLPGEGEVPGGELPAEPIPEDEILTETEEIEEIVELLAAHDTYVPGLGAKVLQAAKEWSTVKGSQTRMGAVTKSGQLYLWGDYSKYGSYADLVNGASKLSPAHISFPGNAYVRSFAITSAAAAAITDDGSLYLWGKNDSGVLGQGFTSTKTTLSTPGKVTGVPGKVAEVVFNEYNTVAALTEDGELYTWGANYYGAVGNGNSGSGNIVTSPYHAMSHVAKVWLGYEAGFALAEDGSLYSWGTNSGYTLGQGQEKTSAKALTPVKILSNVVDFDIGSCQGDPTAAALTANGDLYVWGKCGSGITYKTPVKVLSNVVDFCTPNASYYGSLAAVKNTGELFLLGHFPKGASSKAEEIEYSTPTKIMNEVKSVVCANGVMMAIRTNGDLYGWGYAPYGTLGDGKNYSFSDYYRLSPKKIMSNVESVCLENTTAAALMPDGSLYTWGYGWDGCTGQGFSGSSNRPTKILESLRLPRWYEQWGFCNSSAEFNAGASGYYLTSRDLDKFSKELSNVDYENVVFSSADSVELNFNLDGNSSSYVSWGGSCYGMSATASLLTAGVLNIRHMGGYSTPIETNAINSTLRSAINFYYLQQRMTARDTLQHEFMKLSSTRMLSMVSAEALEAKAHSTPLLVGISYLTGPDEIGCHAIMAVGQEDIPDTTIPIYNKSFTYNHRILVYDCSNPDGMDTVYGYSGSGKDSNIYYDDNGNYCIPAYSLIYDNSYSGPDVEMGKDTLTGVIALVLSDLAELDLVDYTTGRVSNVGQLGKYAYLSFPADHGLNVTWQKQDREMQERFYSRMRPHFVNQDGPFISVHLPASAGEADSALLATAVFDAGDSYVIADSENNLAFRLNTGRHATTVSAGATGSAAFGGSNGAAVTLDTAAPMRITIVSNEGASALGYARVTVESTGKKLSAELTSNGLELSSDAQDITVTVYDSLQGEGTGVAVPTPHADKLLLRRDSNGITLAEDRDGDGSYESSIYCDGIYLCAIPDQVYTGLALRPEVMVYSGETLLTPGRDYTVSYKNNIKAAPASAKTAPTVTVKGIGNFSGTLSGTFTILPADIKEAALSLESTYPANTAYAPRVLLGNVQLKEKTDYTLRYRDELGTLLTKQPTAAGTYVLVVTGTGSCTGTLEQAFTILPDQDALVQISKAKVSVSAATYDPRGTEPPVVTVTYTANKVTTTLTEGLDYTVRYTGLDAKGKGTATIIGKNNYTGTVQKTFSVKAFSLGAKATGNSEGVTVTAQDTRYVAGGVTDASVRVTVGDVELRYNVDYTVTYKNNKKAAENLADPSATPYVLVKGKGNYTGVTEMAFFAISPKDLGDLYDLGCIMLTDALPGKKPALTIYDTNGKKLGTADYTAVYDLTAHTVVISSGKNGFYTAAAPITLTYEETTADRLINSVKLAPKVSFTYSGQNITPAKSQLVVKAGKTVLTAEDYEIVSCVNNVDKGKATVIVRGTNGYCGEAALTFSIGTRKLPKLITWIKNLF